MLAKIPHFSSEGFLLFIVVGVIVSRVYLYKKTVIGSSLTVIALP